MPAHADTKGLRRSLFSEVNFYRGTDRGRCPGAAGRFVALPAAQRAVPLSVTGTRPPSATTIWVFVWPARPLGSESSRLRLRRAQQRVIMSLFPGLAGMGKPNRSVKDNLVGG